jgi:hypothetical protein
MLLDVSQIESIFEVESKGHFDGNGIWAEGAKTAINMRSGDKGEARESFEQVHESIAEVYRAAYGEDE